MQSLPSRDWLGHPSKEVDAAAWCLKECSPECRPRHRLPEEAVLGGPSISISDPSINPLGELRPGPSAFLFGHCPLLPALCLVTKKQAACNWKRTSRLGKGRRLGQKLYAWVFLPWANSYCKIIALFKKHALQVHSMHSFW